MCMNRIKLLLIGVCFSCAALGQPNHVFTPKSPIQVQRAFSNENADDAPEIIRLSKFPSETKFILNLTLSMGSGKVKNEADREKLKTFSRNGEVGGWVEFAGDQGKVLLPGIKKFPNLFDANGVRALFSKLDAKVASIEKKSGNNLGISDQEELNDLAAKRRALNAAIIEKVDTLTPDQVRQLFALSKYNLQEDIAPFVAWNPGTSETGRAPKKESTRKATVVGYLHSHPEFSRQHPSEQDNFVTLVTSEDYAESFPNWLGEFIYHEGGNRMSWRIPSAYLKRKSTLIGPDFKFTRSRESLCRVWSASLSHEATRSISKEELELSDLGCTSWAAEQTGHAYYETAPNDDLFRRVKMPPLSSGSIFSLLSQPQFDERNSQLSALTNTIGILVLYMGYIENMWLPGESINKIIDNNRLPIIMAELWRRYVDDSNVPEHFDSIKIQKLFLTIVDNQEAWNLHTAGTLTFCAKSFIEARRGRCMALQDTSWTNSKQTGPFMGLHFGNFEMRKEVETGLPKIFLIKEAATVRIVLPPRFGIEDWTTEELE